VPLPKPTDTKDFKGMKKAILGIILLSCTGAAFWYFNPAKAQKVETITPQMMPAVQAVYATGTVEAAKMIPISPKMSRPPDDDRCG
jgi:hypothetical protein